MAWFDGGSGRGWLGIEPDVEIEADDLDSLAEVERMWRSDPQKIWLGFITYELAAAHLLGREPPRGRVPGLLLRRFPAALEVEGDAIHTGVGDPAAVRELLGLVAGAAPIDPVRWPLGPLHSDISPELYRSTIERARAEIAAGNTYQINLSQGFSAGWTDAAKAAPLARRVAQTYADLRARAPASMGGLIAVGERATIISNSPETLLEVDLKLNEAKSWPIKGTRPREQDPVRDLRAIEDLMASLKDRAEHVMIVDLVRNELGRIAEVGSVRADPIPTLMALPTVHHLVSEIHCTLNPEWTLAALFEALTPAGSVTGAPKYRTVELITEIEGVAREIYCGSLFVLEPNGLRMSVAIRTGILDDCGLKIRSGGGIVIDSDPELERLETLAKVSAFDPEPRYPLGE
jgi:anthranilate/para-aminobenzoate synthase component I